MINSRKIEDLHPIVSAKARLHIDKCLDRGVSIILTSTLRDDEYQATLYAKGRTAPGSIVTNMEVTGAHGLGLAYDVVPIVDGVAIWDNDEFWKIIGEEGKKLGLVWGGDWKSFVDKPHFEMTEGLKFKDLRAGKRPRWFDMGVRMYVRTLQYGMSGDDVKDYQSLLNKDGHGLVCDGHFGKGTLAATKKFQKFEGLVADGIVGPATQKCLNDLFLRPYSIKWYNKYTQVITIPKVRISALDVIESEGKFETGPAMVKRLDPNPGLLFNGSLFNTADGKTGGRYINEGVNMGYNYYSEYGIKVNKSGVIDFTNDMKDSKDFLGFGPVLVIDGKPMTETKNLDKGFINGFHPRTAFAEDDDNYYIISVHGRRAWLLHKGMTIAELRKFCIEVLHVTNAGNWDGGGSCIVIDAKGRILNTYLEIRGLANAVALYFK